VCSNNVSMLQHFFDTTTFMMYVTASRGPNFVFHFAIKDHRYCPIHVFVSYSLRNRS